MATRPAARPVRPVCVVIPVYRTELSPSERVSLERCVSTLSAHPIVLVIPDTLDAAPLQRRHPQLRSESFPAGFFASVKDYNRLLLADEFYARFASYEYMLVHQLDAFVFADRLLSWCERGYDYVGAPWIPDAALPGSLRLFRAAVRRRFFRLVNKQYRHRDGDHHGQQHYAAGNGGFSLRRVAKMREVLRRMPDRAEPYRRGTRNPWAEDVFFCVEANRYRRHVGIPGLHESAEFSWERYPSVVARFCNLALPFGCHGWDRLHHDEWQPIFAGLGYSLDDICRTPASA